MNYASLRVSATAPWDHTKIFGVVPWYSIPALLARVKHSFLGGLQAALPEPYSSLAGGIVIGGKNGLGSDLQTAFTRSGIVQIIVLSGYNVMIVAEWVMIGFAALRFSRRWSALAGAVAIALFVGVAGASATALRAALMAFIALYARATGRSYTAGRALLAAVLLMLIWNPLYLAFDPGFGLSVAATAGLIWLAPLIESLVFGFVNPTSDVGFTKPAHGFWRNAIATTLAAQIAVLPLLLYDTGNLSLVSIPANIITMPIVPAAMGFSALAGIVGAFFDRIAPLVAIITGLPAYLANAYILVVARGAAAMPFAAFTLPAFPFWIVILAYAALDVFIYRMRRVEPSATPVTKSP